MYFSFLCINVCNKGKKIYKWDNKNLSISYNLYTFVTLWIKSLTIR